MFDQIPTSAQRVAATASPLVRTPLEPSTYSSRSQKDTDNEDDTSTGAASKRTWEASSERSPQSTGDGMSGKSTATPTATEGQLKDEGAMNTASQYTSQDPTSSNTRAVGKPASTEGPAVGPPSQEARAGGFTKPGMPIEQATPQEYRRQAAPARPQHSQATPTRKAVVGWKAAGTPGALSPAWLRKLPRGQAQQVGEEDGPRELQVTPTRTKGNTTAEAGKAEASKGTAAKGKEERRALQRRRTTARRSRTLVPDSDERPTSSSTQEAGHTVPAGSDIVSLSPDPAQTSSEDNESYDDIYSKLLLQKTEPVRRREVKPHHCVYEGEWRVFRTWGIVDWVIVIIATRHGEDEELEIDERDIYYSTQREDLLSFWDRNGGRDVAIDFPDGGFAHCFHSCERVLGEPEMFWVQWIGYREKTKVSRKDVGDLAVWWETEARKRKALDDGIRQLRGKRVRNNIY